ncbi:MAG: hypothetical protein ACK5LJ_05055 [Paracoccus sp. (in: a-proteobacteria)]
MDWTETQVTGYALTALLVGAGLVGVPAPAQQAPLSANDWLSGGPPPSGSVSAWRPGDPVPPDAKRLRGNGDTDLAASASEVADSAAIVPIGVRRLNASDPDGAGVISARQAGLPEDFWQGTDLDTAIRMIRARPSLPASAQITRRVLEAQLAPPSVSDESRIGDFFAARVDQLIESGALPSARDLLQGAGLDEPGIFRRLFNLSLLMGGDEQVCRQMSQATGISTDLGPRVFCLAQMGDWDAAAMLFVGATRLNMIETTSAELLSQYLDDSSAESANLLTPPDPISPLDFRLHEAIGQPLPTGELSLAYAWADLQDRSGWKAQLEAAERLARTRALPAQTLHKLYIAQRPAASGGVWERAAAIQALDGALATNDMTRIGPALVAAFKVMEHAGLRDSFAAIMASKLQPEMLQGEAAHLALWLRLWAGETEVVRAPEDKLDASLLALATGGQPDPLTPALGALAPVFAADLPLQPDPDDGIALAPALYGALADADAGTQGDVTRAVRGVRMLRQLGLIADARRVATQIAIDPLLKVAAQ